MRLWARVVEDTKRSARDPGRAAGIVLAGQIRPTGHNAHINIISVSLSVYTSCLGNPYPHPLPGFLIRVRETVHIILGHLRAIFDQIS